MKALTLSAKLSDTEIIEGCVNGNRICQKALYDRFSSRMFGICLRYAPDYHTAEDLLQEGFVKVFYNIFKYNGTGSFEGWLKRVFINHAIEQLRKSDRFFSHDEIGPTHDTTSPSEALTKLNTDDLLRMVQTLPAGYRTVFNLYVIEGFSHKEIGDALSITEGTSKSQLARAKAMLQRMVEKQR